MILLGLKIYLSLTPIPDDQHLDGHDLFDQVQAIGSKGLPDTFQVIHLALQLDIYSGWSWNWFHYYYGPERSAMPVYGNIVRFTKTAEADNFSFSPHFLAPQIKEDHSLPAREYAIVRSQHINDFRYHVVGEELSFETDKPFVTSAQLTKEMLADTLGKDIMMVDYDKVKNRPHQKLKGIATDSLYKQMLKISDNFLAEQLMVLVADQLSDSLNVRGAIQYLEEKDRKSVV